MTIFCSLKDSDIEPSVLLRDDSGIVVVAFDGDGDDPAIHIVEYQDLSLPLLFVGEAL